MTWIESRIADGEEWRARNANIRAHAVEIYEALIKSHVEEAEQKGFAESTNGAPRKSKVSLEKENKSGNCWELQVSLMEAKDRIRAVEGRVDLSFDLDVCPDGVVCLKFAGTPISIRDAAIRVLDPFCFPSSSRGPTFRPVAPFVRHQYPSALAGHINQFM
jgi:hypothetical protein